MCFTYFNSFKGSLKSQQILFYTKFMKDNFFCHYRYMSLDRFLDSPMKVKYIGIFCLFLLFFCLFLLAIIIRNIVLIFNNVSTN